MDEIFICYCCGFPIIFRNWGNNPHQPFHLGEGWTCWRMQESGACDASVEGVLFFPSGDTPEKERKNLLHRGRLLYRSYLRSKRKKVDALLAFYHRLFADGHGDVAAELIGETAGSGDHRSSAAYVVKSLVRSSAWQRMVEDLRKEQGRYRRAG